MKTLTKLIALITITFFLTLFFQIGWGQVQIHVVDFESATGYSTSVAEFSDGGTDYFTSTFNNSVGAAVSVSNIQGTCFFGAQDTDGDGGPDNITLTIDDVNISGYSSLELRVYLAEDDDGTNQDWDADTYLHITYDIDNSGSPTNLLWVEATGTTNTEPRIDADFNGTGEGAVITSTFTQYIRSIAGTGSLIDVTFEFDMLDAGDEDIAIDHIEIWGTATSSNDTDSQVSSSSTLTEPATISSTVTAANGIQVFDFTFTDVGAPGDGLATIIDQLQITQGSANGVADWTDAIAGAVLNGPDQTNMAGTVNSTNITFAADDMISIANGGNEVYTLSIWLNTDLSGITDNDILEFAMDYTNITEDAAGSSFGSGTPESGDANIAIDIDATQLLFVQQPSNTVVNAAMSPDPTVKACDANGNIDTDYSTAINVSSDGTMTGDPVAGSWTSGVATFASLTHTVVGTGLTLTAGSGALSDEDSGTFDITEAPQLIISEVADPGDNANARFVELYNNGTSAIDLATGNWNLSRQANGSTWDDYSLTGTISAGSAYVIATNSSNFNSAYGFVPDEVSGFISGNGNDGYYLYSGGDHSSGTLVDAYGEIDVDGTGEAWEYLDSRAVRDCSTSPNATWTASEWTITSANVADMDPGVHCAVTNDTDSQVSSSATLTEPLTISSQVLAANGIEVFDFTFTDVGAAGDGLATIIDQLQITQGSANAVADWTDAIAGAVLNGSDQTNMVGTVNATDITFAGNDMISIANGGNEVYTLSIWLNTDLSGISDNDILEFAMDYTNITEDAAGSSFGSGVPESGDANVAVDIEAVKLLFVQEPTNTEVDVAMSPDPTVQAVDANSNLDTDYSIAVTVSSDGIMTGDPVAGTWSSGVATFAGLTHTVVETGRTLTASSGALIDGVSVNFDITAAAPPGVDDIIISEMCDPNNNPRDDRYIEIFNPTASTIDLTGCKVIAVANGIDIFTWNLSGTIDPCEALTCGDDASTVTHDFSLSTWTSSNTNWNGGTNDGAYFENSGSTLVDQVSGTITSFENKSLIRNSNINTPNTTYTASEWTATAVADAGSGASTPGSHSNDACSICEEPTVHASNMNFTSVTETSMTVNWTDGDGTYRIVVAKESSTPDWSPTDLNTYTANASFGAGTELGTGNYVIYNGNGSTVDVTDLIGGTTYYYTVYEYHCVPGSEDYLINEFALTGNETTLLGNVENLSASCITNTTVTLTWDAPLGSFDGILVTVRQGAIPHQPTCADGSTYTSANTDFTLASTYCATTSKYVYNGIGNTVTITNLTNASSYTFKVFTYQASDWSSGTQTTQTADLIDVSNENATVGNTELDISWTNPSNCFDEIMVVSHAGGSVSSTPSGDGSAYTASSVFGSGTNMGSNDYVVYKGTGTNLTITALSNGTEYCSKIFVRKGTEWSEGVEVCETPLNITIIEPGDLMIMAVNTNYPAIGEEFTFVCFKAITAGTPIDFTDNGWERQYDNEWGTTEGTIRLTRLNSDLPAGTSVTVIMNGTNGKVDADFDIFVAGVDDLAAGNWSITELNTSDGSGFNMNNEDDIWIMQNGSWIENTTGSNPSYHDDDYTGNVLYGWTATGWPGSDATGSTAFSNLYPYTNCFITDVSGLADNSKVKYTGPMTAANKFEWIARVNDETNWNGYANDVSYDAATPLYRQNGVTLTINAGGFVEGIWTGVQNTDWFDCGNWQSLTVPDETVDVVIGASATANSVVDDASPEASKYEGIAKCRDLTISSHELHIAGDVNDTLMVYGNLALNSGGILDMDDASKAIDGHLYLYGNWNNQAGEADFKQGEGTIHLVGTGTQTITTNSFTEIFNNIVSNNSFTSGISLNNDIRIDGELTHTDGDIDLNGNNIELRGVYARTTGTFIGNTSSDFSLTGSGVIADLMFINDVNLNNFTINRTSENVNILSDLDVINEFRITAGSVTLSAGQNYDANTLINTLGTADALVLKSDVSGTASLIQNVGAVPATIERYLSGDNWHYIFAPLHNQDIDIFTTTPTGEDNPNFYWYDESVADFWDGLTVYNPTGWTAPVHTGKMLMNKGYIHRYIGNYVYSQTGGNLEVANKNFTLSYTDSGSGNETTTGTDWDNFEGWNLFGNPYVSAVDWDNTGLDKSDIENYVYFYDDTQDKYLCYGGTPPWSNGGVTINGGTQYIPAGQGFFVKANSTGHGQTFSIPESARVHNSQAFYKKGENIIENLIKLNIEKDQYTDETVIRTLPVESNVTEDHDGDYDAYKMFAWVNTKPQLYSRNIENTFYYAVNSIPEFLENKVIPFGVSIGESGTYKINMIENYFENTHIWLEDRSLEINTNLLDVSSYTFNQSAEINNDRFYLHLGINTKPILNINIPDQETDVNEYYSYNLPENMFIDNDFEDELIISASLSDGIGLPEWLSFDSDLMLFSGIPEEIQILIIKVTATDIFGEYVSDEFVLNVKNAVSVSNISENMISVYPNPTTGKIIVEMTDKNISGIIKITDINGQELINSKINSERTEIDLSKLSSGIYFIEIISNNTSFRERIIKN